MLWPDHPLLYEINTLPWLHLLSQRYQRTITLDTVPPNEWDRIAGLGCNAVWLMGVWQRSAAGAAIARTHPDLQASFRQALPDMAPTDIGGSPYSVAGYSVDPELGGNQALRSARRQLAERGLRLLLDFVPNHTAPDHPWVQTNPDCYLQPLRHGRDPYFPPWTDTLQLNAFSPAWRDTAVQTLNEIAAMADGVRCDMAMLLLNRVFSSTWNLPAPSTDFWETVIPQVRAAHPDFLFIAEAYWDLEAALHAQGFHYCYDKRLYDRLLHDDAAGIRAHLQVDLAYQSRLIRFLENHDEPRAAAAFPPGRHRAAAIAAMTLPGAMLLHDGQLHGWQRRLPVQLRRYPNDTLDPSDRDLYRFYRALCAARPHASRWQLLETSNPNFLAWRWDTGPLVIVNFSSSTAEGRVAVKGAEGRNWILEDPLEGIAYERKGDEMVEPGLWVRLAPWAAHLFSLQATL
jgi:hypothetical protein